MNEHRHAAPGRNLGAAVLVVLAFCIVEAVGGWFGRSLALWSDAGHNFADAAALGLSWYAIWICKKPSHDRMTFGYHRVGILAALVNAVSLVVIALGILWEGIRRLGHPQAASGEIMIALAAVALVMNVVLGLRLHAGAGQNINIRAAYIHMAGDAVSALGVIAAGVIVLTTGQRIADPIVSFLIAALILRSSWGILKESVNVLLEGTPYGMDMDDVQKCIASVPGVLGVHDLHVWTVGPGAIACSCHILVAEQSIREGQQILKAVVRELDQQHGINHATIQIEVEGHESNDMYCWIEPTKGASHAGHHH